MALVQETFTPLRLTASAAIFSGAGELGGFFCTTAGTLTIKNGIDGLGTDVVSSFNVSAGIFYPLPFAFSNGCYAVLGGGAIGTFGYLN